MAAADSKARARRYGFRVELAALLPPSAAAAAGPARAALLKTALAIVLEEKDADLAQGIGADGQPLAALAESTIESRHSEMGPADPHAPALIPAHGLSRTRSLLTGEVRGDGLDLWWKYDRHTRGPWGVILEFHRRGASHLPVRDVFGLGPQATARARKRLAVWWNAYAKGKAQPLALPKPGAAEGPPKGPWLVKRVARYKPKFPELAVPKSKGRVSQIEINGNVYTAGISVGGNGSAAAIKKMIANGTFSGFTRYDPHTGLPVAPKPVQGPPAPAAWPKPAPKPKKPKAAEPGPPPATPAAQPAPAPVPAPPKPALPPDLSVDHLRSLDLHAVEPTWKKSGAEGKLSYGAVVVNDKGEVLLREPKGHYGGYTWTWPKGKQDAGEHPIDTALRELREETGHAGVPLGLVPGGHKGDTGTSFFFLMRSAGENPAWMDGETASTKWVSPREALKLIAKNSPSGAKRDRAILRAAMKQLETLQADPHANDHLLAPPVTSQTTSPPTSAAASKPISPAKKPAKPKALPGGFPADPSTLVEGRKLGGFSGAQATLVTDPATGKKWVRKVGAANPGQLREEAHADAVYHAAGVPVAKSRVYDRGGVPVKLAEFHEGETLGQLLARDPAAGAAAIAEARKGFAADALLANWDVAGASFDNLLVTPAGLVIRIDNGGSLRYRAQGSLKGSQWSGVVGELHSLRDPTVNPHAAKLYKDLNDAQVKLQVRALWRRREKVLAAAPPELRDTLRQRLEFMKAWADQKPPKPVKGSWAPLPESEFKQVPPSEANAWGKRNFRAWGASLSNEEHAAIGHYTGSGYKWINPILWSGDYSETATYGVDRATADRVIATLRRILERAEVQESVVVRRGVRSKGQGVRMLGLDPANLARGLVVDQSGFASSSLDSARAFAGDIQLIIRVPKGTKGAAYVNVSRESRVRHELELLVNHGSKFRLVSHEKKNGKDYLTLEMFNP
jgi:8-oxo-dGTP pyrophosphatase MutT (NUDIX family)